MEAIPVSYQDVMSGIISESSIVVDISLPVYSIFRFDLFWVN